MKYLRLYWAFFKASLTADMEFRANFTIKLTTEFLWYIAQIASFGVIFRHTSQIGGWSWPEMRVFLSILFVVDSLFMVLFAANLDNLSEVVRKGSLDLLLTKPVDSQFMISMQRASSANLITIWITLSYLIWSLAQLPDFHWWRALWLVIAIPSGSIVFYSLRFLFASTAIIYTKVESLNYLWYNFYRLGLRPDTIYVPWLKIVVLTVVPVGLIASVPARLVLGIASSWLAVWLLVTAFSALYFSHWFWHRTLRHYTSASS